MQIEIYCVFHIDEDNEAIFLAGFSDIDEVNEYLFEREDSDLNLVVQTTLCDVPVPESEDE